MDKVHIHEFFLLLWHADRTFFFLNTLTVFHNLITLVLDIPYFCWSYVSQWSTYCPFTIVQIFGQFCILMQMSLRLKIVRIITFVDFFTSCFQYLSLLYFNDKIGQNFGNKLKRSKVGTKFFFFFFTLRYFCKFTFANLQKKNFFFFANLLRSVSKALSNESNAKRNFLFSSMKQKKKDSKRNPRNIFLFSINQHDNNF